MLPLTGVAPKGPKKSHILKVPRLRVAPESPLNLLRETEVSEEVLNRVVEKRRNAMARLVGVGRRADLQAAHKGTIS